MAETWPDYSRSERIADASIHACGVVAALMAAPVLITLAAALDGAVPMIIAVSIYGVSLIAMLAFSACYNMIHAPGLREVFRRLDHAAIFVKIAGTYTPFAVVAGGSTGAWLLTGLWSCAALGITAKVIAPRRLEYLTLALYLGMGWAFVFVAGPMSEALAPSTVRLIVIGGLLYTTGVLFHLWTALRFHNAIWHLFVLAGTFVLYAAVMVETLAATSLQ